MSEQAQSRAGLTRRHIVACLRRGQQARNRCAGVGIKLTESCSVGCGHCICACIPNGAAALGPAEAARRSALASSEPLVRHVCFTGGEPFEAHVSLVSAVAAATRHGLLTSAVTSGWWASSHQAASRCLRPLAAAGLGVLSVSCDEYHLQNIPASALRNTIRAATELGIRAYATTISGDDNVERIAEALADALGEEALCLDTVFATPLVLEGRARGMRADANVGRVTRSTVCGAIGPVLEIDGTVSSCCGPALPRGSALVAGNIEDEGFRALYRRAVAGALPLALRVTGVAGLLRLRSDTNAGRAASRMRMGELCSVCIPLTCDSETVSAAAVRYGPMEQRLTLALQLAAVVGDSGPLLILADEKAART